MAKKKAAPKKAQKPKKTSGEKMPMAGKGKPKGKMS